MGIYQTLLYQPILNIFVGLYDFIPDVGVVIIVLTLCVRLLLYPFYKKQVQAQKSMQDIQPKVNELREKYKDNKEEQAKQMMNLYKENKVNPFSSCLPVLIQLPLFLAVYQVLRAGLTQPESLDLLYSFVPRPEMINPTFLGIINLAHPHIALAILAGAAQYWQASMLLTTKPAVKGQGSKDEDTMAIMNKQMKYFMPLLIVVFGMSLPSGLSLYWSISALFMVAQQYRAFAEKKSTKIDEKTEVIKS